MSPRRNRPRGAEKLPSARGSEGPAQRYGLERTEDWRGEEWVVRQVGGGSKCYRCPGCDQEIRPGLPHVVAWERLGDIEDRRHWHKACWGARDRRGPRYSRGR